MPNNSKIKKLRGRKRRYFCFRSHGSRVYQRIIRNTEIENAQPNSIIKIGNRYPVESEMKDQNNECSANLNLNKCKWTVSASDIKTVK